MRTPLSNTPKSFAKNPYRIKGPLCCFRPEPRTQPHFSHSGYSQLFYSVPLPRSTVKGTKGDTAISFCYAFMSSRIGLGTPWCLKRFIFLPLKKNQGKPQMELPSFSQTHGTTPQFFHLWLEPVSHGLVGTWSIVLTCSKYRFLGLTPGPQNQKPRNRIVFKWLDAWVEGKSLYLQCLIPT